MTNPTFHLTQQRMPRIRKMVRHSLNLAQRKVRRMAIRKPSEHPLAETPRNRLLSPIIGIYVRVYPPIAGLWATADMSRIGISTNNAVNRFTSDFWSGHLPIDWQVLMFWSLLSLWFYVFVNYLKGMDRLTTERMLQIIRAVHKVPNIGFVKDYPAYFDEIRKELTNIDFEMEDKEMLKRLLARHIQTALRKIIDMTTEYSRNNKADLGANIMLIFGNRDQKAFKHASEHIMFYSSGDINQLAGVLLLIPELSIATVKNSRRTVPAIALPIPRDAMRKNRRIAIPGAPWAAIHEVSLHEDTSKLVEDCQDFDGQVKDEMTEFFSDYGHGKHVRSFVSFRIGSEQKPIGVINIDSDHVNVLGGDSEFSPTYRALITPILRLLIRPVDQYAQLYLADQNLADQSAHT